MAFTVKYAQLGMKKPVDVKVTNKVLKATLSMQQQVGKAQETLMEGEPEEIFATLASLIDIKRDYLAGVLHLTEKQLEAFDDLETEETEAIVGEMTAKVLGIEEDVAASDEEEGKE